ncbi:MAG: EpsG family protein [Arachidicoccus sp.]|nr:EpsG family protein [Arachidicoccus sp.]
MYLLIWVITTFISCLLWTKINKKIIVGILILILAIFAGGRIYVDRDHLMYEVLFRRALFSYIYFIRKEPNIEIAVYIIPNILKLFFSDTLSIINASFIVFAFMGVSIKMIAISRKSKSFFISVFLYFGYLYLMQEMTTIRAGVASGLFLFMLSAYDEKRYKTLIFLLLLSFMFHYSSVLFIVIFLIIHTKVSYRTLLIALCVSLAIALLHYNILRFSFLKSLFPKVQEYNKLQDLEVGDKLNLFNFHVLFSFGTLILFSIYKKNFINDSLFDILLKIHIISLIFFYLFSTAQITFSIRSYELIASYQLFLYPYLLFITPIRFRIIPFIILIIYGIIQYYYLIDYSGIFKDYQSWITI